MNAQWFAIDNAPPKLTDWIQSIGATIAIIAAIIGFVKLFIKDKKRELELAALAGIAETQLQQVAEMQTMLQESQRQTLEFSLQTEEMQESNKLYRDHLLLLGQATSDTKEYNERLIAMKDAERKNNILPRFKQAGYTQADNGISLQLQLVRNTAYFDSFVNVPRSSITLHAQLAQGKIIGTNENIVLNGTIASPFSIITDYQHEPVQIGEIRFRDEDGNLYLQVISRLAMSFEIGKPESIIHEGGVDER